MLTKQTQFGHETGRRADAVGFVPVEQTRAHAPLHVSLRCREVVYRHAGEPVVNRVDEVETRPAAVQANAFNGKFV